MQVAKQVGSFADKIRNYSTQQSITRLLNLLPRTSDTALIKATYLLERLARNEYKRNTIKTARKAFENRHPVIKLARRLLRELHPNCKKGLAITFIAQLILADAQRRAQYERNYGTRPPVVILVSPTMRCNLRCAGCYAFNYSRKSDLEPKVFDKIIRESKDIGVSFLTILGGEPLIYQPLLDIFRKHDDIIFQVFTNGTLIDQKMAKTLVELGNVAPVISIEGLKEETDARRGEGVFNRLMTVMDYLREEGALFFYSVCTTKNNYYKAVSDEFIDLMIEKGAALGWYFNYMPVGREPNLDLMPTPDQRNYVRKRVNQLRSQKPILLVDFWGDGPLVEGCLAGGKLYLHINNEGYVEPCIFAHYAVDNIKEKSLVEVLNSDFFKAIRRMQPFGHNDIRPCPLIDHPGAMTKLVRKYGAHPTHEGAESLITDLIPRLNKYSQEVDRIYKDVWEKEYQWVKQWRGVTPKHKEAVSGKSCNPTLRD